MLLNCRVIRASWCCTYRVVLCVAYSIRVLCFQVPGDHQGRHGRWRARDEGGDGVGGAREELSAGHLRGKGSQYKTDTGTAVHERGGIEET